MIRDTVGIINTAATAVVTVVSNVYWRHYGGGGGGQCFEMQISGERGEGWGYWGWCWQTITRDPSLFLHGVAAGADIALSPSVYLGRYSGIS